MISVAHLQPLTHPICVDGRENALSLMNLLSSIGMPVDVEIVDIFKTYCYRRLEQRLVGYDDNEMFERLLVEDQALRFGTKISELIGLVRILFEGETSNQAAPVLDSLERFRKDLNVGLQTVHPGLAPLKATRLMQRFDGKGIKIAVYDVFEERELNKQRLRFPNAHINNVIRFGNPVEMDHGNSVIDVILAIAPGAELIPVSSDSSTMVQAIDFLHARKDIQIVNMSRPFLQGKGGGLDPEFRAITLDLMRKKILVKSLGNAGTDLAGNVSPMRQELRLGAMLDMTSFDGLLIKEMLQNLERDYLLLAQNWKIDGSAIALSATVTGDNEAGIVRTVGAPADGVFSLTTGNFESGSSFAAPQVSAVLALLLQAQMQKCSNMNLLQLLTAIRNKGKLLDADNALDHVLNNDCV